MKFKNKKTKSTIRLIGFLLVMTSLTFNAFSNSMMILGEPRENKLKTSDSWILNYTQLILIDDTDPTKSWSYTNTTYDWCTFNGSHYIIENVTINGNGTTSNDGGILIENSEVNFIINNCTILNVSAGDLEGGITLKNVSNGILMENNCSFNIQNGIGLDENCVNITIIDNYLLNNSIGGIALMGANHTLRNNEMINCGLTVEPYSKDSGYDQTELSSYDIDTSNEVNSKSVYFFKNQIGINSGSFSSGAPGQIILVNCSYAVIENYIITNGSKGISLYYCHNSTVSQNVIENAIKGIHLFGCTNITIYDNTLIDCMVFGIEIGKCYFCNITKNENNLTQINKFLAKGISILESSYNVVGDNDFSNLTSGIFFDGYATAIEESEHNNITGNTFFNQVYAIQMYYADNNIISNSIIINCSERGISLDTCEGNDILYNIINGSMMDGIYIVGKNSHDNNISSNRITQNGRYGVYIEKSSSNTIHNNTITNLDSYYGVFIYSNRINEKSDYNDITNNTIEHCLYGIYVKDYCEHSDITLNRLYNNSYGIFIYGRNGYGDHTINYNIIRDNSAYGIYLELSDNLVVWYNTLSNNGVCIYVINCLNYNIKYNSCEPTIYSPDDGNEEVIPGYMLLGVIIIISMLAEILIIKRKRNNRSY